MLRAFILHLRVLHKDKSHVIGSLRSMEVAHGWDSILSFCPFAMNEGRIKNIESKFNPTKITLALSKQHGNQGDGHSPAETDCVCHTQAILAHGNACCLVGFDV